MVPPSPSFTASSGGCSNGLNGLNQQQHSVHVIGFHHNNNENTASIVQQLPNTTKTTSSGSSSSSDKNSNVVLVSPIHYATPKAASVKVQMVPDFHMGKHDMGELNTVGKTRNLLSLEKLFRENSHSVNLVDIT